MSSGKPSKTITGKRIVIAVGGRPTPIDVPGGELALSSDDIFSYEKPPGKTLVIGAS
jgi:thioredoxin reductase (NADPH)